MCNRYANKGSVAEIRRLAALMDYDLATTSATGNLAPRENINLDQDAPVLCPKGAGGVELAMLRGGNVSV